MCSGLLGQYKVSSTAQAKCPEQDERPDYV